MMRSGKRNYSRKLRPRRSVLNALGSDRKNSSRRSRPSSTKISRKSKRKRIGRSKLCRKPESSA